MAGLDSDKEREQKTKNKKEPSNRYEIHRHNKNTNTTEVEYKVAPPVLEEVYKDEQWKNITRSIWFFSGTYQGYGNSHGSIANHDAVSSRQEQI